MLKLFCCLHKGGRETDIKKKERTQRNALEMGAKSTEVSLTGYQIY